MGMGQALSREIHRQYYPCGIRRGLPDGALFLRGAYCHTDAVGRAGFFQLYDGLVSLHCAVTLGKVVFANLSTVISHTATYYTLRDLRENITAKLARVPMGTILDTPSGQYKTTIVDRVEGMEPTFAHLIPEMTANVLVPIVIVVYLLILDWRMALLSLVTLVVGLAGHVRRYEELSRQVGGCCQGRQADDRRHRGIYRRH